ncbi:MAG: hypothetical protein EXR58_00940 [Chloroflexi bacterium]|nr:hypothetical protein [Chloroflexota bacterium]
MALLVAGALAILSSSCNDRLGWSDPDGDQRVSVVSQTLVILARAEPETLAAREFVPLNGPRLISVLRLLNAGLAMLDGQEVARPYLAVQLPRLDTDTWRLLPDGEMETTYALRPNLTWHDGSRLSAEDFVFAWRVYADYGAGQATLGPMSEIDQVTAPDARTVVIHWKHPYPGAGSLEARGFQPLPRSRLEAQYRRGATDAMARSAFWTTEYVGLGPYKLAKWEPGSYLDVAAFDGHAWGRPKIARIRVRFMTDLDAALASLISGDVQVALDDAIRFPQAGALDREWSSRDGGTVLVVPNQWRRAEIQQRADFASPRAILDARVRRALAYSVDRGALNDALFGGAATLADTFIPPTVVYYPLVEQSLARYPYDLQRAEKLMEEAGFTKGPDGIYLHPTQGRFVGDLRVNATPLAQTEVATLADGWLRAGFDLHSVTVPPAQSRSREMRGGFPTLYTVGGTPGAGAVGGFISTSVAGPKNGWVGTNRSGWTNSEYDRAYVSFGRTLDSGERSNQMIEMARLLSRSAAAISLYFTPQVVAYSAKVDGPQPFSPGSDPTWNIHQWELRASS